MRKGNNVKGVLKKRLRTLQRSAIERGLDGVLLKQYDYICNFSDEDENKKSNKKLIAVIVSAFIVLVLSVSYVNSILSARCLLPSNYLVWEATRPLADCAYCENVTKPIILWNVTRQEFAVRLSINIQLFISNVSITVWYIRLFCFRIIMHTHQGL